MNEEQLKIVISAETQKLRSEMDKAKREVKNFGDVSEEQMEAFNGHLESAKETCKNAMKAMTIAIGGAIASVIGLSESTRELRNNQAKVQTAFENAGASAEVATQVYDEMYRVLGDDGQTTEAVAHLAKLTTNEKELAEWTEICTGIYAEFGDSLPIESLTEAANETAKTGTVTGTLADAINWAALEGENFGVTLKEATEENEEWNKAVMEAKTAEDKFNLALQECNSEAEREKKIRELLNKTYKTSADRYKKNNENILKANDAQNKINKSLSKMGDYLEPVNAELKDMGAALLKDLENPMKDVSKFLTNSFFPAIKKTYGWLKDNLPIVKASLVALTTAFVSYKAIALSTKLAEEGLTVAIIAKTAAQKAYNAVMAANPYGLAIAALATLTAGVLAYCAATNDAAKETQVLTEEEQKLITSASDAANAFRDQQEAADETVGGIMIQAQKNKELADELLNLVGANGEVQKADETRVNYILGELNEAYGTEYQQVNGIVQEYDKLKQNIYEVITAKTASAMLEAHNDEYLKALDNENTALGAVTAAQKDYEAALGELNTKREEAQEKEAYWLEMLKTAEPTAVNSIMQTIGKIWEEVETYKNAADEKKGIYDQALLDYKGYYDTKKQYEDAATAIEKGNYQEAIDLLKNKTESYFSYAESVDEATKQVVDSLWKQAFDAGITAEETKKNFENGVEGYTQAMVDEAKKGYEDALNEWATAYSDAAGVGGDLGDGIFNGLGGKLPSLTSKAKSIIDSMVATMREAADSHSPSRKTMSLGEDMGDGAEIGIDKSTKNVVKASQNMVTKSLKAIKGLSATDVRSAINNSIMKANPVVSLRSTIEHPEMLSLLNTIDGKMGANTPIILQVDGKVFAQTAVNTMNERFKQQGKVDLAYI